MQAIVFMESALRSASNVSMSKMQEIVDANEWVTVESFFPTVTKGTKEVVWIFIPHFQGMVRDNDVNEFTKYLKEQLENV